MSNKNYDYILIGAGVVADAISKTIIQRAQKIHKEIPSILILEAGSKLKMRDFGLFQNFLVENKLPGDKSTIYDTYWDLDYPQHEVPGENKNSGKTTIPLEGSRLFVHGGSTLHWGGWSFRLKPEDFKLYTNTKQGIDWPYDYKRLAPYYLKAEHFLGVAGNDNDIYFKEISKNVGSELKYPYKEFPFTQEDGLFIEAFNKCNFSYSNLPIARYSVPKDKRQEEENHGSHHAPCQTTGTCKYCPFGARYNASNGLDELIEMDCQNKVEIRHNAVVNKILIKGDEKNKEGVKNIPKAIGVQYFDKECNEYKEVNLINEKGEDKLGKIIVCAGAIESTKILLRSKCDYTHHYNGLGNKNGLVGRNFITHPYFVFKGNIPDNSEFRYQPQKGFPTFISRHFDSEQEQKKGKFTLINPIRTPDIRIDKLLKEGFTTELINKVIDGYSLDVIRMFLGFKQGNKNVYDSNKIFELINSDQLDNEIDQILEKKIKVDGDVSSLRGRKAKEGITVILDGIIEVFSKPENYIKQTSKRNRFGLLETEVYYNEDVNFNTRMEEIKDQIKVIFEKMGGKLSDEKPSISWRADHAACTTRMAKSDKDGVVDENLKIFDTENIYVCSNSSLPTIGAINPTLTLTAVAIKLAEHLTEN